MRPRVQVDKVTRGTLILHNVMTTTMDNVIIKIKQKCDRSSNFVVCIKQIYCGGLVGMKVSINTCNQLSNVLLLSTLETRVFEEYIPHGEYAAADPATRIFA